MTLYNLRHYLERGCIKIKRYCGKTWGEGINYAALIALSCIHLHFKKNSAIFNQTFYFVCFFYLFIYFFFFFFFFFSKHAIKVEILSRKLCLLETDFHEPFNFNQLFCPNIVSFGNRFS